MVYYYELMVKVYLIKTNVIRQRLTTLMFLLCIFYEKLANREANNTVKRGEPIVAFGGIQMLWPIFMVMII